MSSAFYIIDRNLLIFPAGDYDGALAVFTEMQLLAQEKGLPAPGSNLPVGKYFMGLLQLVLHELEYMLFFHVLEQ